jgi:hypothetical protein
MAVKNREYAAILPVKAESVTPSGGNLTLAQASQNNNVAFLKR